MWILIFYAWGEVSVALNLQNFSSAIENAGLVASFDIEDLRVLNVLYRVFDLGNAFACEH